MAGAGIDLKALVLEASKAGIDLELRIGSPMEGVVLSGQRGMFRDRVSFPIYELVCSKADQGAIFMSALKKMIDDMNEAERRIIDTGGIGR